MTFKSDDLLRHQFLPADMALPVMEFQDQGYKIRKMFALKSTYLKEIIEF